MNRVVLIISSILVAVTSFSQDPWEQVLNEINDSIATGAFDYASQLSDQKLFQAKAEGNEGVLGQLYFGRALGFYRSDPTSGIPYLDSSIYWTEKGGAVSDHIRSLNAKSTFLKKLGKLNAAKKASLAAYSISKDFAPERLFLSARNLSVTYRNLGKYDSALHFVLLADSLAQLSGDEKQQYLSKQGASNIYLDMKNYQEAIKIIRTLLNGESETDQMYELMNLGSAHLGLNQLDSALYAFKQSMLIAEDHKDSIVMANLLGYMGETYLSGDRPIEAMNSLKRSLLISATSNPDDIVAKNNINLSRALFRMNQPKEAREAAAKALTISRSLGHQSHQLESLRMLAISSEALGSYKGAYEYAMQIQELYEQINEKHRVEKIEELKTLYEMQQRERAILSLAQENKIKDLHLSQQRIVLIASFAVFALVVISVVLYYRQYQTKTRQRQLTLEQDVLRTQMNPHFIFNALASIQGLITRNKRKEAATYLAKFGELTRDILEASKKELIPIEKEIEMVTNYVHLEQIRFSKSLELEISREGFRPDDEMLVPPMILQPFVENSIKHGFKGRESGIIHVHIRRSNGLLHFALKDDGVGFEQIETPNHSSLAIRIIRERLQSLRKYAKNLVLSISNQTDQSGQITGVLVKFNLPVIYAH